MKVICPSHGPVHFERNTNLCYLTGISNNDNLCHYTGVEPKLPTYSYPQYDEKMICPPNRFIPSACCDKPRPYNWLNDSCPIPYCRPGGIAPPPCPIPYPNLGLYFPPCDFFRVHC